jgi:tRNA (adenine57-N1/adenine58-N1)-methyltransferase
MVAHTAFLVSSRRMADGVTAPRRQRKPSKGAEAYAALRASGLPTAASAVPGGSSPDRDETAVQGEAAAHVEAAAQGAAVLDSPDSINSSAAIPTGADSGGDA